MINDLFRSILENYRSDRKNFSKAEAPRHAQDYISNKIITKQLPDQLKLKSNLTSKYSIKGSTGVGNMAEIPHICVFDNSITNSAQSGYYIVYLFESTMNRFYMSLNQGWTQYEIAYGLKDGRKRIKTNTEAARTYLRSLDGFDFTPMALNATGTLGRGYELGNICSKVYNVNDIPDDPTLLNDLRDLVGVYRELKGLVGNSILEIIANVDEAAYQEQIQNVIPNEMSTEPIDKKPMRMNIQGLKYPRDPSIAASALYHAKFKCEYNINHETFLSYRSGKQFMEAHHLIPLENHDKFEYSLDIVPNILSLCPNCHRAFHCAGSEIKHAMIDHFLNMRSEKLKASGIAIDKNVLIDMYRKLNATLDE